MDSFLGVFGINEYYKERKVIGGECLISVTAVVFVVRWWSWSWARLSYRATGVWTWSRSGRRGSGSRSGGSLGWWAWTTPGSWMRSITQSNTECKYWIKLDNMDWDIPLIYCLLTLIVFLGILSGNASGNEILNVFFVEKYHDSCPENKPGNKMFLDDTMTMIHWFPIFRL